MIRKQFAESRTIESDTSFVCPLLTLSGSSSFFGSTPSSCTMLAQWKQKTKIYSENNYGQSKHTHLQSWTNKAKGWTCTLAGPVDWRCVRLWTITIAQITLLPSTTDKFARPAWSYHFASISGHANCHPSYIIYYLNGQHLWTPKKVDSQVKNKSWTWGRQRWWWSSFCWPHPSKKDAQNRIPMFININVCKLHSFIQAEWTNQFSLVQVNLFTILFEGTTSSSLDRPTDRFGWFGCESLDEYLNGRLIGLYRLFDFNYSFKRFGNGEWLPVLVVSTWHIMHRNRTGSCSSIIHIHKHTWTIGNWFDDHACQLALPLFVSVCVCVYPLHEL